MADLAWYDGDTADTPKFQFCKVRMMLTMLNHGIPYVSLSQSLSRLCRRTAFHFVEHSSTTRLHSTFDKYIIYIIIYSLDEVADVVWGQLP